MDYPFEKNVVLETPLEMELVYVKREEISLDGYVLFMSFVNVATGEVYQVANLPSFALNQLGNWHEDRYYVEQLEVVFPEFLDSGNYKVFIGMTNNIRTRSMYLGDVVLE